MRPAIAGAPKTWGCVRRAESLLTPFLTRLSGPPSGSQHPKTLAWGNTSCRRPRACLLQAHPLSPGAFRFTTSGTAAGVDTGFGDGFQTGCRSKDLRAFGLRAHPQPGALRHKTRRLWPAGGLRACGQCRQVCRHSPPAPRLV